MILAPGQSGAAGGASGDLGGAVLCGGQSRRMGQDKAMLRCGGGTLLEHAVGVLREVTPRVVLACGPTDRYEALGWERVLDRASDLGPLGGLEAALAWAVSGRRPRETWLLVLACDMPRAEGEVFRRLLERARAHEVDACLLESASGVEPLCAVYRGTCLPAVRRALDAGERKMISFHRDFGELALETLLEAELSGALAQRGCAHNLNTEAEVRAEGGVRS